MNLFKSKDYAELVADFFTWAYLACSTRMSFRFFPAVVFLETDRERERERDRWLWENLLITKTVFPPLGVTCPSYIEFSE